MSKNKSKRNKNKKEKNVSGSSYKDSSENENVCDETKVVTEVDETTKLKRENELLITEIESYRKKCLELESEIKRLNEKLTILDKEGMFNNGNKRYSAMEVDMENLAGATSCDAFQGGTPEKVFTAADCSQASSTANDSWDPQREETPSTSYARETPTHSSRKHSFQNESGNYRYEQKNMAGRDKVQSTDARKHYNDRYERSCDNASGGVGSRYEESEDAGHPVNCGPSKMNPYEKGSRSDYGGMNFRRGGDRMRENPARGTRGYVPRSQKVVEIDGDLFSASEQYSLAHCVAADLRMGSGIAVQFKQQFKRVDKLLGQRKKVGQVAVLEDKGRYIYYLITKKYSTGKPCMEDFKKALWDMKKHVQYHHVTNIAIPRLGCGLDRLHWTDVHRALSDIFQDVDVTFTMYNFTMDKEDIPKKPSIRIVDKMMKLRDIESNTLLVFFGSECGYVDDAMKEADEKFMFVNEYKQKPKNTGDVLEFNKRGELICVLIVKKQKKELFSYSVLLQCLPQLKKIYIKGEFSYIGFSGFMEGDDDLTVTKIITLFKIIFAHVYGEIWICWPEDLQHIYDEIVGTLTQPRTAYHGISA